MKQRDLLFAGLLLLGLPAFAQDEPTRTDKDAKVIFMQNFEADWEAWSTEEIDRIEVLEYYNHPGIHNGTDMTPWTQRDQWQRGLFRTDSLIILRNGILPTDNAGEVAAKNFPGEEYGTTSELSNDNARIDAMRTFGQEDLGGEYVLKYVSDTCTLAVQSWGTYKGGYTANYRRNLFVRGLEIEPNTSYRLTFFIKANNYRTFPITDSYNNTPRLSAGVFRGYYQSEKPFSMGVQNDPDHYKYNTQFEYTKDDFNGQWEKVTYMTYYLNDSIANDFVFADGYWWAEGSEWKWSADAPENPTGDSLYYIVQPDKFFVRLGFLSDFTTFYVDNLSLTKSTIGGAEYSKDKMRIDFGYKTNVSDLANAAKEKTNIAAAEIKYDDAAEWLKDSLNYEDRFEVWGLKDDKWEPVYIRSAEYHDDGYMYMFTDFYPHPITGEDTPYILDDYDSVLVTFHNPIDLPELTLKYTGTGRDLANAFPNALDTNWIKNGKIVPDFYNEIATPNPYVFNGVYSLKDLPPVLQKAYTADGSFFLDPVPSFKFKFSRDLWVDKNFNADNTENLVAYVNDVPWIPSFNEEDSILTITCPDNTWENMTGDVEVRLIQVRGKGTEYGKNVVVNYNFGAPSRVINAESIDLSFALKGEHGSIAEGVITYSASNYTKGDGLAIAGASNQNRLFLHNVPGSALTAGYEVRPHGAGNGGHVYIGTDEDHKITLAPGSYMFKFKGTGWSWNNGDLQPATVYIFPYTEDDLRNVKSADKTQLGVYNASVKSDDGQLQNESYAIPAANVDEIAYTFSIKEEGDYIFEFNNKAGAWAQGVFVGDFELTTASLSSPYVDGLNSAWNKAKDASETSETDIDLYGGATLVKLNEKVEYYKIDGAFDQLHLTEPEAWNAAKKELNDATNDQTDRMAKVDLLVPEYETLISTAEEYAGTDDENLVEYKAIADAVALYENIDYTAMTVDSIVKTTDNFKALVKALNDHRAKIDDFVSLLTSVDEQLGNTAYAAFAEFQAMDSVYNVYESYDVYNNTLDDLNAAYSALKASLDAWNGKYISKGIYDKQVEELENIIASLDGSVPEGVKNLDVLLDDKLGFYMLYAKKALYEAILDDPEIDTLDVSKGFITNSEFWTAITADQVGDNGAMLDHDDLDYVPGWKYTFEKGHPYIGGGTYGGNNKNLPKSGNISNTWFTLDWNTGIYLEQSLVDLPVGNYTLGVGVALAASANQGGMTVYQADTVLVTVPFDQASSTDVNNSPAPNQFMTFENAEGVKVILHPSCGNNGWFTFDNVQLMLNGAVEGFDYDGALDEVEAAITEKLKATAVIPAKAVKGVKYYDVNGVELKAPKAGLNIIVVDGVATKVLVK